MMRKIEAIVQGPSAVIGLAETSPLQAPNFPIIRPKGELQSTSIRELMLLPVLAFSRGRSVTVVIDVIPARLKRVAGVNMSSEVGHNRFSTGFSKEKDSVYRSRRGGSGRSRRLREQQQCQLCSGREGNRCFHTVSSIMFSKVKLN